MPIVSVAVPGPWWTPLSYISQTELPEGVRVRVPLGRSYRVGLTVQLIQPQDKIKDLKEIAEVIDKTPALPEELWKTLGWFGDTWFAGPGLAAKTLLHTGFLDGKPLEPMPAENDAAKQPSVKYIYEPRDEERRRFYTETLRNTSCGGLILFPEVLLAKQYWESLPCDLKDGGALWPASGASKQWELWKRARAGEVQFIVGAQGASFVPLHGLSRIIVDDECSLAWRTQKHPVFHWRSLLAARAEFAGAELTLGGRMPSAKAFQRCGASGGKENVSGRLVFVDMRDSANVEIKAVEDSLPVSGPLVRETRACRKRGEWAFWLLDRKGYAGEIFCEDCGSPVRCRRCGGVMRWEGRQGLLVCSGCHGKIPVPEKCPVCGGPFLKGSRPGLEALKDAAASLLAYSNGNVLFFQGEDDKIPTAKELLKAHPNGGVLVGTRKILSLADGLSPAVIGWIDADAEARSAEYDAKARAFTLLWESAWRGGAPDGRKIVVQSRRPDKGWQRGLSGGWSVFWKSELRERKEWGLPPFVPMLRIRTTKGNGGKFSAELERGGFEFWSSEDSSDEIWVRTRRFDLLKKVLEPYYHIRNTRTGFPRVELSLD